MITTNKKRCSDVDVVIGRRVRLCRIQANLTQEQLGEALDLTFQQVQKYEHGKSRISAGRLVMMAKAFGINPAALLDGLDVEGQNNGVPEALPLLTPQQQRLFRGLAKLPEAMRANMTAGFIRTVDTFAASLPPSEKVAAE